MSASPTFSSPTWESDALRTIKLFHKIANNPTNTPKMRSLARQFRNQLIQEVKDHKKSGRKTNE